MLVVGLTGNIASGKSSVARRLMQKRVPIVDADRLARDAVAPGTPGLAAIEARWGRKVLAADGALDRRALRHIIFADEGERRALMDMLHPAIGAMRDQAVADFKAKGETLVVCDIPLLFESGLEGTVDRIVLVDAPEAMRKDRLMRDRSLSAEEADAMIASQLPASSKRARSHHVIDNTGTLAQLDTQVDALLATLRAALRAPPRAAPRADASA